MSISISDEILSTEGKIIGTKNSNVSFKNNIGYINGKTKREKFHNNLSANENIYFDVIFPNFHDCLPSRYDGIFPSEYERFCNKYILKRASNRKEEYNNSIQNEIRTMKGSCKCLLIDMLQNFKVIIKKNRYMFVNDAVHYGQLRSLECINMELKSSLISSNKLLDSLRNDLNSSKLEIFQTQTKMTNIMLQVSKAVLERTKCMNELKNMEIANKLLQRKVDSHLIDNSELHTKLAVLQHENAQLHNKLVFIESNQSVQNIPNTSNSRHFGKKTENVVHIYPSEENNSCNLDMEDNHQNVVEALLNPVTLSG